MNTATNIAGSSDCTSLALAALQTNDPKDSLILLAACSTKTAIDVQRSHDTAVSALVKAELAEEGNNNSDYTYEIRWKQQREENEKLKERLDRVEAVLRQLVGMVVQTRGAEDDQVRTGCPAQINFDFSYLTSLLGSKYDEELGSLMRQIAGKLLVWSQSASLMCGIAGMSICNRADGHGYSDCKQCSQRVEKKLDFIPAFWRRRLPLFP